jgi:hypothetical protein
MSDAVRVAFAASVTWAVLALAAQVLRARGGGRRSFSHRAGSGLRGVAYNFTYAMLPANKESVRNHPVKFAIGVVLHLGVILCLAGTLVLALSPGAGTRLLALLRIPALLALAAGLFLFLRRFRDPDLRAMSAPDDYVAALVSCGLLALVAFPVFGASQGTVLLVYATALFLYLPLGKLRHAVFFFVARTDLGRRLGARGVYPPAPSTVE